MPDISEYIFKLDIVNKHTKNTSENTIEGFLNHDLDLRSEQIQNGVIKLIETFIQNIVSLSITLPLTPTSNNFPSNFTINTNDIIIHILDVNIYFVYRNENVLLVNSKGITLYSSNNSDDYIFVYNNVNYVLHKYMNGKLDISYGSSKIFIDITEDTNLLKFNEITLTEEFCGVNGETKTYRCIPYTSISVTLIPDVLPNPVKICKGQFGYFHNDGYILNKQVFLNYVLSTYDYNTVQRKNIANVLNEIYSSFKRAIGCAINLSNNTNYNSNEKVDDVSIYLKIKNLIKIPRNDISWGYSQWLLDISNTGTEEDYLNSLEEKERIANSTVIEGLTGPMGPAGPDGNEGATGPAGTDGTSTVSLSYCDIVSANNTVSTTSKSYITANNMTITPPAGSYLVVWTCNIKISNSKKTLSIQIFKDSISQGEEVEYYVKDEEDISSIMACAKVTVDGSQSILGKWKISSKTGYLYSRSLVITQVLE